MAFETTNANIKFDSRSSTNLPDSIILTRNWPENTYSVRAEGRYNTRDDEMKYKLWSNNTHAEIILTPKDESYYHIEFEQAYADLDEMFNCLNIAEN